MRTIQMVVEVSDLYDAFFQIATIIWQFGEFEDMVAARPRYVGPNFDELCDQLEYEFFYAACARRVAVATGHVLRLTEVKGRLRLHDANGVILEGEYQQQYLHQAFDWGTPQDRDVENQLAAGDLTPRSREDTRIFLHFSPKV